MTGNFLGNVIVSNPALPENSGIYCALSFAILAVLGIVVMAGTQGRSALHFFPIAFIFHVRFFDRFGGVGNYLSK